MPLGDWQFWIVSVLGLAGLAFVLKMFLPRKRRGACSGCGTGPIARRRAGRTTLTIEKRPLS